MWVVVKRPAFLRSLESHFDHIAADDPVVACDLVDAVSAKVATLSRVPWMGKDWSLESPAFAGVRSVPVSPRFRNYLLFFRIDEATIEMLDVLHAKRDLSNLADLLFPDD
jgi:plasmid stabilization system protein ParE